MAPKPKPQPPTPDLKEFLATFVDVVEKVNEIDQEKWQSMTDEDMLYFTAGARVGLVALAEQRYPGHMYSFTQPRVDEKVHTGISEDRRIVRKVRIRFHAFIFDSRPLPEVTLQADRAAFYTWACNTLNTFHREDPLEALADAWAMGFRPKEAATEGGGAVQ